MPLTLRRVTRVSPVFQQHRAAKSLRSVQPCHSLILMTAKSQLVVPIRAVRKAYGITIEDLVERIAAQGVTVMDTATIRNVETGNKRPSDQLRFAWARALGLSPLDAQVIPGAGQIRGLPSGRSRNLAAQHEAAGNTSGAA